MIGLVLVTVVILVVLAIAVHARRSAARIRKARADARFALLVADELARGARRRPRVDSRIQRRRYAR